VETRKREALERNRAADAAEVERKWPNAQKSSSGLRFIVEKEGSGPKLEQNSAFSFSYKASLLNGQTFDSSDVHGGQ
jgi:FKBP-type peptidyl-prolyl cis-trans isomerase